ncbi:MAG: hypothetical protein Q8Q08_12760, partial [Candidatus Omnitrophota bacterium]|nr:hypothetical protein [Candidatus Omnitrophota bacterium]
QDYCNSASMNREHPRETELVLEYGRRVAQEYRAALPELYAAHESAVAAKILKEWRIEGTPFTSGIVNKNNPLKYHFDSGNFKGVYSNMLVFKRDIEGGHLSCPEYGIGFELKHNSLLMFDGQDILHGVKPIRRLTPDVMRYSIVYYSLRKLWQCQPVNEEIARIRRVKTVRELKRRKR